MTFYPWPTQRLNNAPSGHRAAHPRLVQVSHGTYHNVSQRQPRYQCAKGIARTGKDTDDRARSRREGHERQDPSTQAGNHASTHLPCDRNAASAFLRDVACSAGGNLDAGSDVPPALRTGHGHPPWPFPLFGRIGAVVRVGRALVRTLNWRHVELSPRLAVLLFVRFGVLNGGER